LTSHVSPRERGLIEAVLAFANLRSIESNREVEDLFRMAAIDGEGIAEGSSAYRDRLQPLLRRWLADTIRSSAGRAATAAEVKHLIPHGMSATPEFSMGRLWYDFHLSSVRAGCALALALILDSGRGLTGRLQQCTLSSCGRFSVDFDSHGRPRKYCSVSHKNLANYEQSPARMRHWRRAIKVDHSARPRTG
jgi:hypothetical protein